ncbi:hypothetical protein GQ53DRAFT_740240 [Thozetella sp. PMI_491]|nr:hypothetical protein GQ53DRAFT_740240 [Thozetella sp. PMI_491]
MVRNLSGGVWPTPLSHAAAEGHEAVVRLLLKNGADLKSKDDSDQTPLWLAIAEVHDKVMRVLRSIQ